MPPIEAFSAQLVSAESFSAVYPHLAKIYMEFLAHDWDTDLLPPAAYDPMYSMGEALEKLDTESLLATVDVVVTLAGTEWEVILGGGKDSNPKPSPALIMALWTALNAIQILRGRIVDDAETGGSEGHSP